jgi:hypothetical protein
MNQTQKKKKQRTLNMNPTTWVLKQTRFGQNEGTYVLQNYAKINNLASNHYNFQINVTSFVKMGFSSKPKPLDEKPLKSCY